MVKRKWYKENDFLSKIIHLWSVKFLWHDLEVKESTYNTHKERERRDDSLKIEKFKMANLQYYFTKKYIHLNIPFHFMTILFFCKHDKLSI